ncbi:MAG: flagellar brake domain-containing protein [candidate division Zixibacteria bacterium]|nr:flagellar brake domain-containing protein [candidate division Zixibacteria bacterium]MDD5425256.1 flagellar brake domain-containing protein [candidate division Zixibacteria bacterium]
MLQVLLQRSQPLRIWEKIEIIVGEGSEIGKYVSRVEDFINNGIVITQPVFVEGHTLLREGTEVNVRITRDDATYQFVSIIKQISSHNKRFLILTPPKNIQRVQRRMFVRVDLSDNVAYANLAPVNANPDLADKLNWQKSNSLDISGGGILLHIKDDVKIKDLLMMEINFFKECGLPRIILGSCKRICKRNNISCAGLEFVRSDQLDRYLSRNLQQVLPSSIRDFDYKAQDKLVNMIFHKQIELRQKGLL